MSFHRENVTWQSKDGTWNMAFFRVVWEGSESDGMDPEWDVIYDHDVFAPWNYATACTSADEAYQVGTANTSNPGGTWVIPYAHNERECDRYDKMLQPIIQGARK